MYRSKKCQLCITLISWLLVSCQAGARTSAPTFDVKPVRTIAAATAYAQLTELAAIWIPTPVPALTSTPSPTTSSFSLTIDSLLGAECEKFGETVFNQFISLYGNKGCKLPMLSPNGKYLAYVTLIRQETATGIYFVDGVKILKVDTNENDKEVYMVHNMDYVGALEWSTTGQLIIWEYLWEGPWVVSIYDPVTDAILVRMRLDEGGALHWSPQHSAFYVTHTGEYGANVCVGELGGYDFQSNKPFPDLYKVFNMQETNDDPFGIPYGKNDNLYMQPFDWSPDGQRLWLTVTPLYWEGDQAYKYKLGPKQAGTLEFSKSGVVYQPLASDSSFDYSFEGPPNPKIVSRNYQPHSCP